MIKLTNEEILDVAVKAGCKVDRLKAYHKITYNGGKKAIYVARSKHMLTRIDFSGFTIENCEIIQEISKEKAKKKHLGSVQGQIIIKDLGATEEQVLEAFDSGLEVLKESHQVEINFEEHKVILKKDTQSEYKIDVKVEEIHSLLEKKSFNNQISNTICSAANSMVDKMRISLDLPSRSEIIDLAKGLKIISEKISDDNNKRFKRAARKAYLISEKKKK